MPELPTHDQLVPTSGLASGQWVTWTKNGEQYRVVAIEGDNVVLHFAADWDFYVPRSEIAEGVS